MKKIIVMVIMLVVVGVLFGAIFLFKYYISLKIKEAQETHANIVVTVSSVKATTSSWKSEIHVVGSTRTVKGVNVTPELAGMVTGIHFEPGTDVEKGKLLVQLDISTDVAKLHQLEAESAIAGITYHRDLKQFKIGGVSKETVDQDEANFKSTSAQVEEQKSVIEKKTVRAPFSGRLGVRLINVGQYLNPGDSIVTLQAIKPIYIDFYVPQKEIPRLKVGQTAEIKLDAYSQDTFEASITTINPIVDQSVRNILVEATYKNNQGKFLPGMFTYITLKTGKPKMYVTLPQMAITFNPYGSIVYILKKIDKKFKGKQVYKAYQRFVTTGEIRGNQVAVLKGVAAGDMVVSTGQLKIKNNSLVVINNSIQPPDNPNPYLPTE